MEAVKYNVLPIDSSFADRMDPAIRPNLLRGKTDFTYYPGMIRIPEANSPDVHNKSFRVTAEVEIPERGPTACWRPRADGSAAGACSCSTANRCSPTPTRIRTERSTRSRRKDKTRIAGADKLAPGKHTIAFDFVYDGGGLGKGGKGTLTVDGKTVAESRIEKTNPLGKFTLDESFDVGMDTGSPVIDEYDAKMPFKFTGVVEQARDPTSEPDMTHPRAARRT